MTDVGVLDKVMSILSAFEDGRDRQDPTEVARRAGITTPTAYRLMRAMNEHGLLASHGRRFALGPRLMGLGALAAEGIEPRSVAPPFMRALRDETGETVVLQVLSGHHRVPVEIIIGSRAVRTTTEIGEPMPVHVGASSRVLLAPLGAERALQLAQLSADEHPDVPWSPEAFVERLPVVAEQGWETSDGERDPEFAAVAAPIHDRAGAVVASLVLSLTTTRFADPDHRAHTLERTVVHARAISQALAGGDDHTSPDDEPEAVA